MEVMNLILWDRRSLEYGESRMGEDRLVHLPPGPVLPGHVAVVRCAGTPREAIALVVCPQPVEAAAASQPSLEVIDAR